MLPIDRPPGRWETIRMRRHRSSKGLAQRTLIGVLLAFALLMTAFAHRPVSATPAFDAAAYTLPDGSLPVFCLPSDGKTDGSASSGGCEFCRLAASVLLPETPAEPDLLPREQGWDLRPLADSASGRPAQFPAAPPQGPPAHA